MNKSRNVQLLSILLVAFATLLSGCATNTMTGRMQARLVSDAQVSQRSVSMYTAMETDFRKKNKVVTSGPVKDRVDAITNRLIEQAVRYRPEARDWNWRVMVIDDPKTVNAFCMPGGLMGIYSGFFEKLNATDEEVAQVMGHEIGHALAGHGAEKVSQQIMTNMAVVMLSAALSQNNRQFNNNQTALTVGALAFVNLPNSRETETEADRIGIELAARAGYSPRSAAGLWHKMATESGDTGRNDFFKTHPASIKRAEFLEQLSIPIEIIHADAVANFKPPYDWLNGSTYGRPTVDPSMAIALYSPEWDKFQKGQAELKTKDSPAFFLKQRELKEHYEKSLWRDLARKVMDIDLHLDLTYYYLGRAAHGLGFKEAGDKYLSKASELAQTETDSCAKRTFVGCSGINVAIEVKKTTQR